MTYSEKLKDGRWLAFREEFIKFRMRQDCADSECDECGEDTRGTLHVHHRRYIRGREPWEYDFSDLRLICEGCHDRIHEMEQFARAFIIALPPHLMYEMRQVFEELAECQDDALMKIALAHAKNAIRGINHRKTATGAAASLQTMAELEEEYRTLRGGQK